MAGVIKAFRLPVDYVLYDMSYANLVLYGASLPAYRSPKTKNGKKQEEVIRVDDPRNSDKVLKLLRTFK